MEHAEDFLYAFGIGVLLGVGELVGRYRDEPGRALRSMPALLYVGINGIASAAALILAKTMGWTFGAEAGTEVGRLTQILVTGFGAMGLFRSALFIYRHEGEDIGIGPVAFLQVMMDATDRAVDRRRAKERDEAMGRIMFDLSFDDIAVALPTLAGNVMQNFSAEDQIRLGTQVKNLRDQKDLSDRMKVIELGLIVMNVVGENVLKTLVTTIRRERDGLPVADTRAPGLSGLLGSLRRGPTSDSAAPQGPAAGSSAGDNPAADGSAATSLSSSTASPPGGDPSRTPQPESTPANT
jgi:hypothetical protein